MADESVVMQEVPASAVLFASAVERLAMFYVDALGFCEGLRGSGYVVLRREGFELTLHAVPAAMADAIGEAAPVARRSAAAIKLAFAVTDLASLRTCVANSGGVLEPPEREWSMPGMRAVDGVDPEGNVFQLRQYVRESGERSGGIGYAAPVFAVADLARALVYYRECLGFAVEFSHADFYASIERDGCRIHLKCVPGEVRNLSVSQQEDHIDACLGVRNAAALAAEFAQSGAEFAVPLRQMPYGCEFYVRDPDRNVMAFVEGAKTGRGCKFVPDGG